MKQPWQRNLEVIARGGGSDQERDRMRIDKDEGEKVNFDEETN